MLTTTDRKQLKVAVAANHLYGALLFLFGAIVLVGGLWAAVSPPSDSDVAVTGDGLFIPMVIVAGGAVWTLWGAALLLLARRLQHLKGRMFCIVVSAVNATSVPIGTLLGILTVVLLMKPSVADAFE